MQGRPSGAAFFISGACHRNVRGNLVDGRTVDVLRFPWLISPGQDIRTHFRFTFHQQNEQNIRIVSPAKLQGCRSRCLPLLPRSRILPRSSRGRLLHTAERPNNEIAGSAIDLLRSSVGRGPHFSPRRPWGQFHRTDASQSILLERRRPRGPMTRLRRHWQVSNWRESCMIFAAASKCFLFGMILAWSR